ncbi:MAG: hypothetical protein J6X93_06775 [Bacilli bacterium]|nr:hypothetical protein [Bacilli bacterium]
MKKKLIIVILLLNSLFLIACKEAVSYIHQYELVRDRYADDRINVYYPAKINNKYVQVKNSFSTIGASFIRKLEIDEYVKQISVKNINRFVKRNTTSQTFIIESFTPTKAWFYINTNGQIISVINDEKVYISEERIIDYNELIKESENFEIEDIQINLLSDDNKNEDYDLLISFNNQRFSIGDTHQINKEMLKKITDAYLKGTIDELFNEIFEQRSVQFVEHCIYLYEYVLYVDLFNKSINKELKILDISTSTFGYDGRTNYYLSPGFNLDIYEYDRISCYKYNAIYANDSWIIIKDGKILIIIGELISYDIINKIINKSDSYIASEIQRIRYKAGEYYEKSS